MSARTLRDDARTRARRCLYETPADDSAMSDEFTFIERSFTTPQHYAERRRLTRRRTCRRRVFVDTTPLAAADADIPDTLRATRDMFIPRRATLFCFMLLQHLPPLRDDNIRRRCDDVTTPPFTTARRCRAMRLYA